MEDTEKAEQGFEELLNKLEGTVTELEQGRLNLEQMLERYAAGIELIRECRIILRQAEQSLPEETGEAESCR